MSGGHLCKTEAPTKAEAENSIPSRLFEMNLYERAQRPSRTIKFSNRDTIICNSWEFILHVNRNRLYYPIYFC